MTRIDLTASFAKISEHWRPKVIAELNGQEVKLVKIQGEFVWHHLENEDEMFLVVKGELTIRFRDRDVHLREGEFLVVPRGVEYCPVAAEEAHVLLFEPAGTLNTGNVEGERSYVANPG